MFEGGRGHKCSCIECGKEYSSAHILKRHLEFVHEGRRDYTCPQCGKDFDRAISLKTHIESVHEGGNHSKQLSDVATDEENFNIVSEINKVHFLNSELKLNKQAQASKLNQSLSLSLSVQSSAPGSASNRRGAFEF